MRSCLFVSAALAVSAGLGLACAGDKHHDQEEFTQEQLDELERKWGMEWPFVGIGSFAHLKYVKCLTTPSEQFDIAIVGAPFDTAVSYRPGARFGPRAIRQASSRQTSFRGFNPRANINPYQNWAKIIDCGDIPVTPMDNAVALQQMTAAFGELGRRRPVSALQQKPKLITLGGDHSLALAALRALKEVHGKPVRVLHFDAHLDTWHPTKYPNAWPSDQASFNHGSMFWLAGSEGLIANSSAGPSVHAGLRTRLSGNDLADYDDDTAQNWVRISADDIDDIGGAPGVAREIVSRLGTEDPVYLSVDIDVLDPAFAPGTGTPEPGGWTTRELIRILRGIEDLNIVGADVVEVSPAYQGAGEETALAAAQVVYEIISSIVKKGMGGMGKEGVTVEAKAAAKAAAVVKDEL
ncbi:agmatinase [Gaeumannomyces tritici R3-111a-1]|uniref:Agmatinase n=1 Tax=Gaeumannomyces tritici (strain R3-111a-1) TaxID=644352 RepID=J3P3P6_GAET3|nr:agmatinase [Gaeumannomyces tritici R3-111a-1]EJT74290.1 agmatinase [Gaeumannomyces tritici R3-111a-1]